MNPISELFSSEPSVPVQPKTDASFVEVPVRKVVGSAVHEVRQDQLAVEEPLEIRLAYGTENQRTARSISVTMRTPGHDPDLAAGFLLTEGIVRERADLQTVRACGPAVGALKLHNVIRAELHPGVPVDLKRLERHFYTTSSCGVCGKTSIEALQVGTSRILNDNEPLVAAEVVHRLPEKLRETQAVFDCTGGLHAAGLFDGEGNLLCVREDVGRHNAVDKLIGAQFLAGKVPLHDKIIMVSGRASFELMQKALMGGIPILAAVGAPSSLAVEMANRFGMTLLGFVREGRFNVYAGQGRVIGAS